MSRRRVAGVVVGVLAMTLLVWVAIGAIQRRADVSQIPDGWTAADDHMCEAAIGALPPQPTMIGSASTEPSAGHQDKLMLTESQLTVFTPGGSPLDDGRVDGVTFTLRRVADTKYVIADLPTFACGPSEPNRDARDFDAPPHP